MIANDISPVRHLQRHAAQHGAATAVVYEGREWTYREFADEIHRFAAALRADGIGPGDRIAYAGVNSITFIAGYFAAAWVGAAFVPLNFRLAGPELRAILLDARPDVLVAEPYHAGLIDPFLGELSVRRPLLVDDDAAAASDVSLAADWQSYEAFRRSATGEAPPVTRHEDDLAVVLYTSGTTGRSKGVLLTHGNIWWNWVNVDTVVDTRVGDVYLAVAPLFHIGGLNALTLRTLTRGGTVVVRRAFDPAQALDDLVNLRVNTMFVVPAMLAAIGRQPGFADADLTALRSTIAAGAPVPPALIASYAERGVYLQQAWGLTETSPFATYLESGKTLDKLGSCGVPMPYTEVKIVDPATHAEVDEATTTGELWVRGPNVSSGYWNNPEATAAAFTPEGWFRTGDIGYRDADGYFFIVDRLKDMIISGGENVYPAEIENVLNAHPMITDVAVVGVPDEKWGEAVCAVVSLREGTISLDEVRDFAALSIARYKLPTRLLVWDEVPRNGAGKLDKPTIRPRVAEYIERHREQMTGASFTASLQVPR
ncbi:long-chain fatty acid--CoA ligase [Microbacterium fluvii]|uniref:Long-chain fatty acid--CoA ligase n=1 Tax=Microbacterium fluvii TaxID=415215 RepID=A0ABW2HCN3_9MICO|nr:long-chain fatty acid--CoA ligase [Microbacterium fluvii]MCU4672720.1 long-chain fatty acid--CoA ligase [Microbacterium fluvii]